LKKPSQKRTGGVAQGIDPEFKPQYHTYTHTKVHKETSELNHSIDQMDLTDIHRILHSTDAEYTFSLVAHRTFSKVYHIGNSQ
jgi:hypothetical protein